MYLSGAFLFYFILNTFPPYSLMCSNTLALSCVFTNSGSNHEGGMEAKPVVVNPSLRKHLECWRNWRQMFVVKDSAITYLTVQSPQKGKKNYRKYLSHLKQEIFKSSQVRKFENRKRDYRTVERTNMKLGTPGQRLEE